MRQMRGRPDTNRGEFMQAIGLARLQRRLRGFSLTELLVVIAVATILLSIVFVMAHGLYKVVRSFQ
jgi:prepilin-type N-terminal cleavage/methylation domain-containing protein